VDWDVLIVGAGPAGATSGALLKKYRPHLRVALLERAAFPRYHIGESLIIEANRILHDMDALDRVAAAAFLKKGGATFVWGEDRDPWSLLFDDGRRMRPDPDGMFRHTWHVERERYDTLLLDVARGHGVEVLQPCAVEDPIFEGGRVAGVRTAQGTLRARAVIDASGRAGVVARHVGRRVFDPLLRNVAVFGYWRGARLDPRYSGTWELSRIVVVSIPVGWIWYIPLAPGLISVGVVTSAAQPRGQDAGTFYRAQLDSSPEVAAWLAGAELTGEVRIEADFNYCHDRLAGDGYLLAGDAGGFVDPLFSIGVFLAQSAGQLAAYFLGAALDGEVDEARAGAAYAHHLRSQYEAFRAMAYVFYGFNSSKEAWWQETRALMRTQALPEDIDEREAFMALTFGFGVNLTLFREAISCFGQLAGPQLREILLRGKPAPEPELRDYARRPPLPGAARPRLVVPHTVAPSVIPIEGTGRVMPLSRVELGGAGDREARFPRALYLPDDVAALLPRLDGATPASALGDEPAVQHLLRALDGLGVLA
jgi:clorobiocin biosynthesis protein Clo-hal/halogenation protein CepH